MGSRSLFLRRLTSFVIFVFVALLAAPGCKNDDDDDNGGPPAQPGPVATFRGIAGVSMGAYGAMNLGSKHPDRFGVIASLGGPVDMRELLRHIEEDNLEVKAQAALPSLPGDDFTFDHLPPYPDRDTRIEMMQDLFIAFGNPFLHHRDPARRYLAKDSEPATIGQDDRFGALTIPTADRGFQDGGDSNEDGLRQTTTEPAILFTDVLLLAVGTLGQIAPGSPAGMTLGERTLTDLNGDGVFDVGDGIVLNPHEPFDDLDGDGLFEPADGESFQDDGLDGVAGTGDLGEGNGSFDFDPDRQNWLDEDPVTRLDQRAADLIAEQKLYMDVGTTDAFEFEQHYLRLVEVLENKGLRVDIQDDFLGDCVDLPEPQADRTLVRYPGGHVGIPEVDNVTNILLTGDICGSTLIWQRILGMLGFFNEHFPDGFFGPGGIQLLGETELVAIESPALALPGDPAPTVPVVVYRPPAFFNTNLELPVVYFMGGYGQDPEDFERVGLLFDLLIDAGRLQNFFFVVLPGNGVRSGSFFVNHRIPHQQVPNALDDTSGRYEDMIMEDLIPTIEEVCLEGRVRE